MKTTTTPPEPKPDKPKEFWRVKVEVFFDVKPGGYAEIAEAEHMIGVQASALDNLEVKAVGHRKVKR